MVLCGNLSAKFSTNTVLSTLLDFTLASTTDDSIPESLWTTKKLVDLRNNAGEPTVFYNHVILRLPVIFHIITIFDSYRRYLPKLSKESWIGISLFSLRLACIFLMGLVFCIYFGVELAPALSLLWSIWDRRLRTSRLQLDCLSVRSWDLVGTSS